jgi:hypothetical protein
MGAELAGMAANFGRNLAGPAFSPSNSVRAPITFFWAQTQSWRFKHCFFGSNRIWAAQTLFFGLKQKSDGSNIVLREKTMFEGMGRKSRGSGAEIWEETPRNPVSARSSRWIARKRRKFTGYEKLGRSRTLPPAKAQRGAVLTVHDHLAAEVVET